LPWSTVEPTTTEPTLAEVSDESIARRPLLARSVSAPRAGATMAPVKVTLLIVASATDVAPKAALKSSGSLIRRAIVVSRPAS